MLDVEFLRNLGIKAELLPAPNLEAQVDQEHAATDDLPLAGEYGVPPEIWGLDDEEMTTLLEEKHSQANPYRYRTPKGHIVAVYPQSCEDEGRFDIGMTAMEFKNFLSLNKVFEARIIAYETRTGVRVPW